MCKKTNREREPVFALFSFFVQFFVKSIPRTNIRIVPNSLYQPFFFITLDYNKRRFKIFAKCMQIFIFGGYVKRLRV